MNDELEPGSTMDPYDCDFCGERLADSMLAFMEHIEENETCRTLWELWKQNVQREAGGS